MPIARRNAVNSTTATVTVCSTQITTQPQDTTTTYGNGATLTVAATGAPLSYQWYRGVVPDTSAPLLQPLFLGDEMPQAAK